MISTKGPSRIAEFGNLAGASLGGLLALEVGG
jgi:hypothetical protein